jgi:hypothetical protein
MKFLTRLIQGLSGWPVDVIAWFDLLWLDLDPQSTRHLDEWEQQFGLYGGSLTEQERRDRLDAAWGATGGQSVDYIETTMRNNGFMVTVTEWWEPGSEPPLGVNACATPKNPFSGTGWGFGWGENWGGGGSTAVTPLVNVITIVRPDYLALCGEAEALCGEAEITCGNYLDILEERKGYTFPADPACWAYILYISGDVAATRKDEFERLLLKICPCHLWLGLTVNYI